mgnify:CR=1 FL=1
MTGKDCVLPDPSMPDVITIVDGDLDLHGAEISCDVDLKRTMFRGQLKLADATFATWSRDWLARYHSTAEHS